MLSSKKAEKPSEAAYLYIAYEKKKPISLNR